MLPALDYLRRGLVLVRQPGLRRYALLPLLANLLVFGLLLAWVFGVASDVLAQAATLVKATVSGGLLHDLIDFLLGVLQSVVLALLLFLGVSLFATLLHLLAAPFNGLLAEQVEERHTGLALHGQPLPAMVRRTLLRSLRAFRYWAARALVLAVASAVLALVPLVNAAVPALWFLFGAWMTAIAYFDYPADNRGVPFDAMLAALATRRAETLAFGAIVFGLMLVPLVNLFVMPVAVAAATLMWLERFDTGRAGSLRRLGG